MKKYTYLNMLSAIRTASTTPHIKVGIFVPLRTMCRSIFDEILESIKQDDEEFDTLLNAHNNSNRAIIEFKNGSYIKVLSASENARGNRFHHVLYENGISNDLLHCVVKRTEILRTMENL